MKRTTKIISGVILLMILGLGRICAAEYPLATNIANLANMIARQFGVVEVKVAAIQGDQVYINAGKNQYVKVGAIYEIVAEEGGVTDPGSRVRIGSLETHVAEIRITTLRDRMAIGKIIEQSGSTEIKVGQKAVQKPKILTIAVIPFTYLNSKDKVTTRIVQELMINEMIKTGRFEVADSLRTEQITNQLRSASQPGSVQFTKAAGQLLGVDYILYGTITDLPGSRDILCRVHDASSGTGLAAGNVHIIAPTPLPLQ